MLNWWGRPVKGPCEQAKDLRDAYKSKNSEEADKKNAEDLAKKRAECTDGAYCLVQKVMKNIIKHPKRWKHEGYGHNMTSWENKKDNMYFSFWKVSYIQTNYEGKNEFPNLYEGQLIIKGVEFKVCHWDSIRLEDALKEAMEWKKEKEQKKLLKEMGCEVERSNNIPPPPTWPSTRAITDSGR